MSFAYLPLYTGDYFRDTRGLSMAGHGCYLLLLTYCWDSKGPLPLDDERIAGICEARSQEERNTMMRVLTTYFVKMPDGWYNTRMQREIDRCEALSNKRSYAGREGANERMRLFRERNLANAKQEPSKSRASAKQVTESPSPSPSLTSTKANTKTGASAPDWIPAADWERWRKHRGRKLTAQAIPLQVAKLDELRKAGHDPTTIINLAIESGWATFYEPKSKTAGRKKTQHDARAEVAEAIFGNRNSDIDGTAERLD